MEWSWSAVADDDGSDGTGRDGRGSLEWLCSLWYEFGFIFSFFGAIPCPASGPRTGTWVKRCAWVMRNMRGVVDRIGRRDLRWHCPKWFRLKGLVLFFCPVLFYFWALFAQPDVRLLWMALSAGFGLWVSVIRRSISGRCTSMTSRLLLLHLGISVVVPAEHLSILFADNLN